jgi:hypothetical protein
LGGRSGRTLRDGHISGARYERPAFLESGWFPAAQFYSVLERL